MPKKANRHKWIETGYRVFGESGPDRISVNSMARELGLSRTSFYHHFGDVDEFIEILLEYHEEIGRRYHKRLLKCKRYAPDLINLIIEEKTAFLFHRRLLGNRSVERFEECAKRIDETNAEHTYKLWAQKNGLEDLGESGRDLFAQLVEAWWLKLGPDSFEYETLRSIEEKIASDLLRALEPRFDERSRAVRTDLHKVRNGAPAVENG